MKPISITLAMLTLVALATPSLVYGGDAYRDPIYGYAVTSDVVYGYAPIPSSPSFALLCDIYQPTDIGLGPVPANRPVVVIQDGGAWTSGSKTNGRVVRPARYICQRGFTVIITDYRYWDIGYYFGGFTGDTEFGGRPYDGLDFPWYLSVFPGEEVIRCGIEDFSVAMAWVKDNAAWLGIDVNRVCACGGSSGGINVLCNQYNNNPVPARYRANAVMCVVSTMYGNWDRINAGAPPCFMLNNIADPLIFFSPDVPDFDNRLLGLGIYLEQWFQETRVNHDFDDDECVYDPSDANLPCVDIKERMKDYCCYHLAGGPLQVGYTLALAASPSAGGSITADPPPRGDGTYEGGTIVTLTANPAGGFLFSDWSGGASGSSNPTTVTMNANKSVTANFVDGQVLTLNVVNASYGTVTVDPNLPLYAPGTPVTLTATPVEGRSFREWTVWSDPNLYPDPNFAVIDSNLVLQLTMDHDYTVEAAFKCGSGMDQVLPLLVFGLAAVGFVSRRVWWRG